MAPRDGEAGWREGERDGEREEGEREVEDGDGELCGMSSGRAAARATMAEDSSLESHTVTSWRVCEEEMEKLAEFSGQLKNIVPQFIVVKAVSQWGKDYNSNNHFNSDKVSLR